MNRSTKIGLVSGCSILAVALVAVFLTLWLPAALVEHRRAPPPPPPWDFELYYTAQSIISIVSIILSVFLLIMYTDSYRKTRSDFSVALMIFSIVLLLSSLTSNPAVQSAFGFKAFGLGPFAMLPLLFQCIGLAILSAIALR
jgi:hypothetical protein